MLSYNYREQISLTKYRCANSKILVYNQIYMYETELCTLCDLNVNGDEYYYIMICQYFKQSKELGQACSNSINYFPLKTNVHCPGCQNLLLLL